MCHGRACGECAATYLLALDDNLAVVDDLDGALVDLGTDVEGLEERGLRRVQTGRTLGHGARDGGNDTRLGGRGLHVLLDDLLDRAELAIGEDEADVANHVGNEGLPLRVVTVDAQVLDATANHGVLTEDKLRLAAEGNADVGNLLRADEIHIDNEGTRVFVEALSQVSEVKNLLAASDHSFLED